MKILIPGVETINQYHLLNKQVVVLPTIKPSHLCGLLQLLDLMSEKTTGSFLRIVGDPHLCICTPPKHMLSRQQSAEE